MNKIASKAIFAASILLAGLAPSALQGAAVIYESFTFSDGDTSLAGNSGGTGLTGNWSGAYSKATNLSYGSLATSGDAVSREGGWSKAEAGIDMTNTGYTNLLADNGDLWFSMLVQVPASNHRTYFALSSRGVGAANGDLNGDGTAPVEEGVGIGFGLTTNETFYGNIWDDADNGNWGTNNLGSAPIDSSATNTGAITGGTYFVVGHVQWGSTSSDLDTLSLYLPGTDLVLGTAVSTATGLIADQSGLDRLGIQHLGDSTSSTEGPSFYDEIRIGGSYADVAPIPEPSTALLGVLGMLLLLRRHRD